MADIWPTSAQPIEPKFRTSGTISALRRSDSARADRRDAPEWPVRIVLRRIVMAARTTLGSSGSPTER